MPTARYIQRVFPALDVVVRPHVENPTLFNVARQKGNATNVILLGAINADKGSLLLHELASRALMAAPELAFWVVGYTDIDKRLSALGNVAITGRYGPDTMAALVRKANSGLALFLHRWPETFSYTLSEAVQLGLVPLVPDIGAPAERVRRSGYGYVFDFPIDTKQVLSILRGIVDGTIDPAPNGVTPAAFRDPDALLEEDRASSNVGRLAALSAE